MIATIWVIIFWASSPKYSSIKHALSCTVSKIYLIINWKSWKICHDHRGWLCWVGNRWSLALSSSIWVKNDSISPLSDSVECLLIWHGNLEVLLDSCMVGSGLAVDRGKSIVMSQKLSIRAHRDLFLVLYVIYDAFYERLALFEHFLEALISCKFGKATLWHDCLPLLCVYGLILLRLTSIV